MINILSSNKLAMEALYNKLLLYKTLKDYNIDSWNICMLDKYIDIINILLLNIKEKAQ